MPDNKHALLRYRLIDQCLTNRHRIWTKDSLLKAIADGLYEYTGSREGISPRTFFDDLLAMKPGGITGYEAPIHRTKARGYHYTDPDYSINQMPLTGPDVVVLQEALLALRSIRGVGLATALDDIIRRLEGRLAPVAPAQTHKAAIQFETAPEYAGSRWLQPLYEAIRQRQPLRLHYQPYHAEAATELLVHPYLLKAYQHRWFLVGHAAAQPGLRVFALDRIADCAQAAVGYVPTNVDFTAHFQHVIGPTVAADRSPETVHLRFSRGRAPYVRTKPLHGSQRILSDTPAGLELTLHLIPNPELLTQLLSFGPDVEVLAPTSLRTAILKRLRGSLARYAEPADASTST